MDKVDKWTDKLMDKFDNPSPNKAETNNPQDYTTMAQYNRKVPPLEGGNSQKLGRMWTLNHDISSPKFYEIIINTDLKGETDLDLKIFYNHTNMCLNVVTKP